MKALPATTAELAWLAARTGAKFTPEARGIKAVGDGGDIRGMVAFDGWTPNSCYLHMAVDSAIAWRELVPAAAHYVFQQVGLGLMLGLTRGSNARALRFIRAIGFREVHRIRDGFAPGEDLVVSELRKEDARIPWRLHQLRRAA